LFAAKVGIFKKKAEGAKAPKQDGEPSDRRLKPTAMRKPMAIFLKPPATLKIRAVKQTIYLMFLRL